MCSLINKQRIYFITTFWLCKSKGSQTKQMQQAMGKQDKTKTVNLGVCSLEFIDEAKAFESGTTVVYASSSLESAKKSTSSSGSTTLVGNETSFGGIISEKSSLLCLNTDSVFLDSV